MRYPEVDSAAEVLRLISRTERDLGVAGVARRPLTAADEAALLTGAGISATEAPLDGLRVRAWMGEERLLCVRAALDPTAKSVLRLGEAAYVLSDGAASEAVQLAYGLAGVINCECVRRRGAGWLTRRLDAFRGLLRVTATEEDCAALIRPALLALLHLADARPSAATTPSTAVLMGVLCRAQGDHRRSTEWLRAAVDRGGPAERARALLGLGVTYRDRGNLRQANSYTWCAYRSAVAAGEREVQGAALHNLLVSAAERRQPHVVASLCRAALAAYGPGHERLPTLAADVASMWLLLGHYHAAIHVYRTVLGRHGLDDETKTLLHANYALAAAAVRDARTYGRERRAAKALMREARTRHGQADLLCTLAEAGLHLGAWASAGADAGAAMAVARRRGEARWQLRAEELIGAARARDALAAHPYAAAPEERGLEDEIAAAI